MYSPGSMKPSSGTSPVLERPRSAHRRLRLLCIAGLAITIPLSPEVFGPIGRILAGSRSSGPELADPAEFR